MKNTSPPTNISVIITTYNRPAALTLVLKALAAQTQQNFEVIIADDGSTPETAGAIKTLSPSLPELVKGNPLSQLPYPLRHVWQPDLGFRAAMARNRAIAVAKGEYLIFLDGDCIPAPDFIFRHSQLAESGWFIAGNRILLSKKFTQQVITEQLPLWTWQPYQWIMPYLRRDINRLLPLLRLPDNSLRKRHAQRWQGAKTCNLAVWHQDILTINGFNEHFEGWGHEDAELVVRLLRSGVQRKEGRFAVPVLHLWHPENDRSQEPANRKRLEQILDLLQNSPND